MPTTTQEIQRRYEHFARWYDLVEGIPELFGIATLRRALLHQVGGRILEVGVGTGRNFRYYPTDSQVMAVDLTPAMLRRARSGAARLRLNVRWGIMEAERLGVRDQSFDTVVSTLSLCTFVDPVAALREMARVCRAGGRIFLLEHGRSDRERIGRWQDRWALRHATQLGCHWNRQPIELVRQAGLMIRHAQRTFLGIFHSLQVSP